jgi:plastocyanin
MWMVYRLSTVLSVLTWVLGWAAYPSAGTVGEYRFDGSKGQDTGSVIGTVWLVGAYERPARLKVFKNRDFCGPWVPNESLLVNSDGGVQNAVVVLRPADRQARVQPASIVLDNRNCAFAPHVQVATVGSELRLKNSDPILHTVHARLGKETLFNVGLPRWRQVTKTLTRSGIIRINCDVLHTWMSAAIVVTQSPYFALTDQYGRFAIEQLPVGEYEMETWHEKLGTRNRWIRVSEGAETSVDVVYSLNQKTP